jgi:catechol-2,3-dioxygenase
METVIADLVQRFERGGLSRRQLIQGLSVLVTANAASPAGAQSSGLRATGIDHVSVLVDDLQRSADFYQTIFGMSQVSEDKQNRILRLGAKRTIVSLRREAEKGIVDHFAISVENFNKEAVTQELKRHNLTPQENVQYGFYIKDPDGMVVQMV